MKTDERYGEVGMQKCQVIFERALIILTIQSSRKHAIKSPFCKGGFNVHFFQSLLDKNNLALMGIYVKQLDIKRN